MKKTAKLPTLAGLNLTVDKVPGGIVHIVYGPQPLDFATVLQYQMVKGNQVGSTVQFLKDSNAWLLANWQQELPHPLSFPTFTACTLSRLALASAANIDTEVC